MAAPGPSVSANARPSTRMNPRAFATRLAAEAVLVDIQATYGPGSPAASARWLQASSYAAMPRLVG